MVLELKIGRLVLGGGVGEEGSAVVLLVLEGVGWLVVEDGGGEVVVVVVVIEDAVVMIEDTVVMVEPGRTPGSVTDVTSGLEAVVAVEDKREGLSREESVGMVLSNELKEELVAMDEVMKMMEERSSGEDETEAEAVEAVAEAVMLRNKVGEWRPITHETLTMQRS
jgi:hypothetical protein